jgi:hypothetical protein
MFEGRQAKKRQKDENECSERCSKQQAGENSLRVGQDADDFAARKNPFSYQCWQGKNLVILRALKGLPVRTRTSVIGDRRQRRSNPQ